MSSSHRVSSVPGLTLITPRSLLNSLHQRAQNSSSRQPNASSNPVSQRTPRSVAASLSTDRFHFPRSGGGASASPYESEEEEEDGNMSDSIAQFASETAEDQRRLEQEEEFARLEMERQELEDKLRKQNRNSKQYNDEDEDEEQQEQEEDQQSEHAEDDHHYTDIAPSSAGVPSDSVGRESADYFPSTRQNAEPQRVNSMKSILQALGPSTAHYSVSDDDARDDAVHSEEVATALDTNRPMKDPQGNEPVRVAVRVRPFLAKELASNVKSCVSFPGRNQILIGKRQFTFDYIFPPNSTQEEIYESSVRYLVEGCFLGYNATVFAYGQTGSGKTWTMGSGSNSQSLKQSEIGIIPRVVQQMFHFIQLKQQKQQREKSSDPLWIELSVSYLELYQESLRDLLHPETPTKSIHIREDAGKGIVLSGVKEEKIGSYMEMLSALNRGNVNRTVGATLMNEQSSRSHSIFTITMEQRRKGKIITSKCHLIDLAGSERSKKTGATGVRFKESVNINQGLLALGNVISALAQASSSNHPSAMNTVHIGYRQSKLTRLLQGSLGGNSRTLMIATVSGAEKNFEESLTTLKYAQRARFIKNKPVQNVTRPAERENSGFLDPAAPNRGDYVDSDGNRVNIGYLNSEMVRMREEILNLHQQLAEAKLKAEAAGQSSARGSAPASSPSSTEAALVQQLRTMTSTFGLAQKRLEALATERTQLVSGLHRLIQLTELISATESERDSIKDRVIQLRNEYETLVKTHKSSGSAPNPALTAELADLSAAIKSAQQNYIERRDILIQLKKELQQVMNQFKNVPATPRFGLDLGKSIEGQIKSEQNSIKEDREESGSGGDSSERLKSLESEIDSLKLELTKAREDLAYDDEIFNEKAKEIAALQSEIRSKQDDNERLEGEIKLLKAKCEENELELEKWRNSKHSEPNETEQARKSLRISLSESMEGKYSATIAGSTINSTLSAHSTAKKSAKPELQRLMKEKSRLERELQEFQSDYNRVRVGFAEKLREREKEMRAAQKEMDRDGKSERAGRVEALKLEYRREEEEQQEFLRQKQKEMKLLFQQLTDLQRDIQLITGSGSAETPASAGDSASAATVSKSMSKPTEIRSSDALFSLIDAALAEYFSQRREVAQSMAVLMESQQLQREKRELAEEKKEIQADLKQKLLESSGHYGKYKAMNEQLVGIKRKLKKTQRILSESLVMDGEDANWEDNPLVRELNELELEKDRILASQRALEANLSGKEYLRPMEQQHVRDLEERMDVIQEKIEYQTKKLKEMGIEMEESETAQNKESGRDSAPASARVGKAVRRRLPFKAESEEEFTQRLMTRLSAQIATPAGAAPDPSRILLLSALRRWVQSELRLHSLIQDREQEAQRVEEWKEEKSLERQELIQQLMGLQKENEEIKTKSRINRQSNGEKQEIDLDWEKMGRDLKYYRGLSDKLKGKIKQLQSKLESNGLQSNTSSNSVSQSFSAQANDFSAAQGNVTVPVPVTLRGLADRLRELSENEALSKSMQEEARKSGSVSKMPLHRTRSEGNGVEQRPLMASPSHSLAPSAVSTGQFPNSGRQSSANFLSPSSASRQASSVMQRSASTGSDHYEDSHAAIHAELNQLNDEMDESANSLPYGIQRKGQHPGLNSKTMFNSASAPNIGLGSGGPNSTRKSPSNPWNFPSSTRNANSEIMRIPIAEIPSWSEADSTAGSSRPVTAIRVNHPASARGFPVNLASARGASSAGVDSRPSSRVHIAPSALALESARRRLAGEDPLAHSFSDVHQSFVDPDHSIIQRVEDDEEY